MAGKEVREYTNLSDPKGIPIDKFLPAVVMLRVKCSWFDSADRKWGKGKDKIDDEDITFQRMVAKVSQSALLLVIVSFLPILYVSSRRGIFVLVVLSSSKLLLWGRFFSFEVRGIYVRCPTPRMCWVPFFCQCYIFLLPFGASSGLLIGIYLLSLAKITSFLYLVGLLYGLFPFFRFPGDGPVSN